MSFLSWLFGRKPENTSRPAPLTASPTQHASTPTAPDWRSSPVHLFALERFLDARDANGALGEHWTAHLGETPLQVIDRFVAAGALEPVSLARKLEYILSAPQLKALVKERGLKVGGSKKDLAERLVQADPDSMSRLCDQRQVLTCSAAARELVERFLSKLTSELQQCIAELRVALDAGNFSSAVDIARAFLEKEPVRPKPSNPLAIEERPRTDESQIAYINLIFQAKPPLLKGVSDQDMREIATVTAIAYLLKRGASVAWLAPSFVGEPSLDHEVTLRMMYFHLNHLEQMATLRAGGVRKVKVQSVGGCDACQAIADKVTAIDKAPMLPYEHCTCTMGCRCIVAPVLS